MFWRAAGQATEQLWKEMHAVTLLQEGDGWQGQEWDLRGMEGPTDLHQTEPGLPAPGKESSSPQTHT